METASQGLPPQSAIATSNNGGRAKISTSDFASSIDSKKSTEQASQSPKKGDKSKEKSLTKVSKPSTSNAPSKATWKAVVRKLPPYRDFGREQFEDFSSKICRELRISPSAFVVEHYIDGKISRKRGPINGAGFITFQDETAFQSFLANCAAHASSVFEDTLGKIEVSAAPYPRSFRQKPDKNENTYEADPEFLAFQERLKNGNATPVARLVENETLSVADKVKSNPLLSYLRDKAIEKAQRRRGFNAADDRSNRKKAKKDKKAKEKLSRKERKKLKIMKKASSSISASDAGSDKAGVRSGLNAGGKGNKDLNKRPSTSGNQIPSDSPAAASILQKGTMQKQHNHQKANTRQGGGPNKQQQQQQQQQSRKDNANSKLATATIDTNSAADPARQTEYRNSGGGGRGSGGSDRGRGGGGRGDNSESKKPQGQQPQVKVLRKDSDLHAAGGNSNS